MRIPPVCQITPDRPEDVAKIVARLDAPPASARIDCPTLSPP